MMTPYDQTLLPPEPSELDTALHALTEALGLAAAAAQDAAGDAETPTRREYHHGRASGLRLAQRLVLALAAGAATTSQAEPAALPPDLDF